jgi:23S rRNA (guanine2445-N2)-methyltransferase / 23S rRNA (guanine2069-N7)-methyltransferase
LLWSRLASRVLLQLAVVPAASADELYAGVRELAWEDHVGADGTIAVDATGTNEALRDTRFIAVRVKDAVADRFRDSCGRRPSVDTTAPDLRINVALRADSATISIDLAGEPLHRRGYREPGVQVAAPMKETLAAAVLAVAGWSSIAKAGGAFVDPMCGSGTLAIEAALVAADIAPGLLRREHAIERWLGHDEQLWSRLVDQAEQRRARGLKSMPPIAASDYDTRAIEISRSSVRRAGLTGLVAVEQSPLSVLRAPAGAATGLVATNPPYGERLSERSGLPALYAELAARMRAGFAGWKLAVITSDAGLERGLGMKADLTHQLYNGRILAPVRVFSIPAAALATAVAGEAALEADAATGTAPTPPASSPAEMPAPLALTGGADAFANRLRKMSKHYAKWARRGGVSCYRVYDADLPDYSVAVDIYEGAGADAGRTWVHVAEYAAPADVDPAKASARLGDVLAVVPEVLGVDPANVFLKRRERQRGSAQYDRMSRRGVVGVVGEGGLLFEVNLSDYLDTGLFLDHRQTRAILRDTASGTRFLNLFAYTGTASVYAAAGGAVSTTTVDLSPTYLEWAGRNMSRNGFPAQNNVREQADVQAWIEAARRRGDRYDLVFCDPPTFSNSKRAEDTWDIQRDHGRLIAGISEILSEGGTLVFSCNRRKFALDEDALAAAGLTATDITARTVPKDFERRAWVHHCWTIRHA